MESFQYVQTVPSEDQSEHLEALEGKRRVIVSLRQHTGCQFVVNSFIKVKVKKTKPYCTASTNPLDEDNFTPWERRPLLQAQTLLSVEKMSTFPSSWLKCILVFGKTDTDSVEELLPPA